MSGHSSIAVLICIKYDAPTDLALASIRSTAASLTDRDCFFVRIDGAPLPDPAPYLAAAAPVPLRLYASARCDGLAEGLNALLEEVLVDPHWHFIARMDADDESLPARMQQQRNWLQQHPAVDVLGTACLEVDESGRILQCKRMPLSHAAIFRTLPRSNPINHPTVMLRRRVFIGGLRYRTDVRRTEDYHLWIDAMAAGFRFANLPEPLLRFRRDARFFHRRGGWRQACADFAVRWRAIRMLGLQHPFDPLWALMAFVMRLLPGPFQAWLYASFR
jgi:hypothetical protein